MKFTCTSCGADTQLIDGKGHCEDCRKYLDEREKLKEQADQEKKGTNA